MVTTRYTSTSLSQPQQNMSSIWEGCDSLRKTFLTSLVSNLWATDKFRVSSYSGEARLLSFPLLSIKGNTVLPMTPKADCALQPRKTHENQQKAYEVCNLLVILGKIIVSNAPYKSLFSVSLKMQKLMSKINKLVKQTIIFSHSHYCTILPVLTATSYKISTTTKKTCFVFTPNLCQLSLSWRSRIFCCQSISTKYLDITEDRLC